MAKEKLPSAKELNAITSQLKKSAPKEGDVTVAMVLEWMFDGDYTCTLPNVFLRRQYKLKPVINNIMQKFRTIPRMQLFVNNHVNNLYSHRSESEILAFFKSYVQINKIQKHMLDKTWFQKSDREAMLQRLSETRNSIEGNFGDIVSEYDMIATGRFEDDKTKALIEEVKGVSTEDNSRFEEAYLEMIQAEQQQKIENDPRFIKDLNQEVIDSMDLTLIDIKTIERQNKILLIFIDKNNLKKFFMYDFVVEFFISNIFSIIYNDYVVPFDKNYHQPYLCTDFKMMENIRRAINTAKDKFYKEYAWSSK